MNDKTLSDDEKFQYMTRMVATAIDGGQKTISLVTEARDSEINSLESKLGVTNFNSMHQVNLFDPIAFQVVSNSLADRFGLNPGATTEFKGRFNVRYQHQHHYQEASGGSPWTILIGPNDGNTNLTDGLESGVMLKKDSVEIRPENICPDTCLTLALVHKEKPWEPEVAVVYMYRSKIAYAAMKSGDDAGYFAFRAKKSSGLLMVNKETEQNRISGKKNLKIMIADYVHNNPLAYACLETAIIEHAAKYGVEPQLVRGFHGTSPNIILSGDGKIASVYCDARYKWKINDSERKTLEKSQDPTLIAWSRSANAVLLWSNWIAAGTIIRGFGYQVTDIDGNLHNENTAYIFDPTDINANPETTLLIRPAAGFYPLVNNDYDIMPAINSGIQDADIIIRAYKNGINPMRQILNQIEVQTAGK